MKTYEEVINVVLDDDYKNAERFNDLSLAIKSYEKIKIILFGKDAKEEIFESGERVIKDSENKLLLEFVYNTCADEEFKILHPASIVKI